jgi:hypothetical protein
MTIIVVGELGLSWTKFLAMLNTPMVIIRCDCGIVVVLGTGQVGRQKLTGSSCAAN